jgi:Ribosomal protein L2
MGIRTYKPTSAGRRNASVSDFAELTPGSEVPKNLRLRKKKTGGRNNQGKITVRHRGGGQSSIIAWSTFVGTRTVSLARSTRFSTIRIAPVGLLWSFMLTAKNGTSLLRMAWRLVRRCWVAQRHRRKLATVCRFLRFLSVPRSTTSSCSLVVAGGCVGQPAPVRSCSPARRDGRSWHCPRAKSGECRLRVGPQWGNSATASTWILCLARLDASVGWASGLTFAARRWIRLIIRMVVVRAAIRVVATRWAPPEKCEGWQHSEASEAIRCRDRAAAQEQAVWAA